MGCPQRVLVVSACPGTNSTRPIFSVSFVAQAYKTSHPGPTTLSILAERFLSFNEFDPQPQPSLPSKDDAKKSKDTECALFSCMNQSKLRRHHITRIACTPPTGCEFTMSISTPRLFPQVQGWAHGNLWVASHGTFGPQDELDLFDANLDADALVRLAGTLRENAIITLKGLLNYDGQIDPELIIGLVDDENPNPPGTYFVEGRILHFFACLSIILPETVIRIHGVFKTLTSLGSIFPGWPQHPAVHMGDEQPEDVLCTMIRYFYRWGQAIRVYFKMWRDDSRDAVEIRKAVNLLRTRAGKAHAIWLPVRNSLVEFQDIHKFRYVDTLIRKFDMAFWTLDWELQLSENLARRLEEGM